MIRGRATGIHGITVEFSKCGMWRFNRVYYLGRVSEDWKKACIIPLYNGKRGRQS